MFDYSVLSAREIERLSRSIRPGEWAVESSRPISTLLGSCVAVCLYDTGLPLAGMNHFMLPRIRAKHASCVAEDTLLAGEACLEALLDGLLSRGAARHRLKAKAFGGGAVIQVQSPRAKLIGEMNVEFTREWLDRENIPLIASDFLGNFSRKVLLVPMTGDAYCKRMTSKMISEVVLDQEEAFAETLAAKFCLR